MLPRCCHEPSGVDRPHREHRRRADDQPLLRPVITMYFDDHGHPHFQVRHAEGAAKIRIDVIEVLDSNLAMKHLRLALAWAELHQDELLENWRRAQAGETVKAIDPLK